MSEKKPDLDKERENTNRIEMGSEARAKKNPQQEKASVTEYSPQGQKWREKTARGHMRPEKKQNKKTWRKK